MTVVPFTTPKKPIVAKVFGSAVLPGRMFHLLVFDPEKGDQSLGGYPIVELKQEILALREEAAERGLEFEVHDHSDSFLFTEEGANDNRPPEYG
jgi:hypothetical protein